MKITCIYVTASDIDEANMISNLLISERLAACANILGGIRSIYRWEDKVCDENEIALILKTNESLVDKVISRVKEIHSYDCPCILAFPANRGNPEFISWILEETNI